MNLLPGVYVYNSSPKIEQICELLKTRGYKIYLTEPRLHYLTDSVIYYNEQKNTWMIAAEKKPEIFFALHGDAKPDMMLFYRFPIDQRDQTPILRYFDTLFETGNAGFPREHGLLKHYVEIVTKDEGVTVIGPPEKEEKKFICGTCELDRPVTEPKEEFNMFNGVTSKQMVDMFFKPRND